MKHLCSTVFRQSPFAMRGLLAVCIVLLSAACTNEETNPPYVAVTSGSFTFSQDTQFNLVQVESNTDWQVCWTPQIEGVVVNPASGSGNGSFVVENMPEGKALQFAVCHGTGAGRIESNPVQVARMSAGAGLYLTVTPKELTYSTTTPTDNVITITTNSAWTATVSNPALLFTPASGSASGKITVTDMAVGQTYMLTITVGEGEGAIQETVSVTRAAVDATLLYYNDFDKALATQTYGTSGAGSGTYWPYLAQSDCWQNQQGKGSSTVSHLHGSTGVSARNNYNSDSNFSGVSNPSKKNNLHFSYAGAFVEIRNISIPAGTAAPGYELSFLSTAANDVVNAYVSGDGSRWVRVPIAGGGDKWKRVTTQFALNKEVSTLSLMLQVVRDPGSYGIRIDDVKLTTTAAAPATTLDLTTVPTYAWPEVAQESVFTNFSTTVVTGQPVRNYTVYYLGMAHIPAWVAYPQHFCYQEGGLTRPTVDPWAKEPQLSDEMQSYVYDGYSWVTADFNGSPRRWGRGHMLASSYRGCGDPDNPAELNKQTFMMGNVAPQAGEAFDKLWAAAEKGILDNCVCADTLYCISGAWDANPTKEDGQAKDKSTLSDGVVASQPEAKECVVPTHYYKVLLRTKDGNTGKAIQECSADELQAVAFWFTHADTDPVSGSTAPTAVTSAYLMSVKALCDKVGYNFFPDVPASVKEAAPVAADWALPYAVSTSAD